MKFLGNLVSTAGIYMAYFGFSVSREMPEWDITNVLYCVPGVLVAMLGYWISKSAMVENQARDDRRARTTISSANAMERSLFLRPFDLDGQFRLEETGDLLNMETSYRPGAKALERIFADAMRKTSPLIGLGERGGMELGIAAGGFLDTDWKQSISRSIETADYVFLIPSANAGTLWEMSEVMRLSCLHKCVLIMPSTLYPFEYIGLESFEEKWDLARTDFADELSIELPHYSDEGLLFTIGTQGQVNKRKKMLSPDDPRQIAQDITSLFYDYTN